MAIIYPASFMDAMPNSGPATLLGTFNLAPPAQAYARSPGVFVLTAPADTAQTASTEVSSVYYNLSATRTYATGALALQREYRIAAPTYAFVGASTITLAATVSISGAPIAGTNATITNSYALHIVSGRVRFDGAVVQNVYPVLQTTGTIASPVTTINTPAGVTVIASAATSVTVTCAACTTATLITAVILNATSNNVSIRAVIPGSGSFVVHVTGDPGVSTAIIGVRISQPGTGV